MSDSGSDIDDWEERCETEKEEELKPQPTPSKAKPERDGSSESQPQVDQPLDDKFAEKQRRQKLVEDGDNALMDDMFEGIERPDGSVIKADNKAKKVDTTKRKGNVAAARHTAVGGGLDGYDFDTVKGLENVATKIGEKITGSKTAKSQGVLRFATVLIEKIAPKIEVDDLRTLQRKIGDAAKQRQVAQSLKNQAKKKPNDMMSRCRNAMDELDIVYGGDDEDEEDEEEEDIRASADYYESFM